MRWMAAGLVLLGSALMVPAASAHGALVVNELETLAISDFEGQEDSFAWEGFEIWDVYVGEGHSQAYGSDGVYFKANLAGDGTLRPTSGEVWSVTFTFTIGTQAYTRQLSHDGAEVTTDFEELEWQVADGNVFQVRAWVPVPDWAGLSLTDLILVSAVDGEPRDTAPGGIHVPGTGTEVPVAAPATPIFPPLGKGRIVDSVPLTGPGRYLNVSIASLGDGAFEFTVRNPLAEQGQHAMLALPATAGWTVTPRDWSSSVEAGQAATFTAVLTPTTADGSVVEPMRFDLLTDIGGRQSFYAFVDQGAVAVVEDPATAQAAAYGQAEQESPGASLALVAGALAVALLVRASRGKA